MNKRLLAYNALAFSSDRLHLFISSYQQTISCTKSGGIVQPHMYRNNNKNNNTLALYILLLALHLLLTHIQTASTYLIRESTSENKPLSWNSSPALDAGFSPRNKRHYRSLRTTASEQDKLEVQKSGRLEERVDLKCP